MSLTHVQMAKLGPSSRRGARATVLVKVVISIDEGLKFNHAEVLRPFNRRVVRAPSAVFAVQLIHRALPCRGFTKGYVLFPRNLGPRSRDDGLASENIHYHHRH